jgi:hypothetical protein
MQEGRSCLVLSFKKELKQVPQEIHHRLPSIIESNEEKGLMISEREAVDLILRQSLLSSIPLERVQVIQGDVEGGLRATTKSTAEAWLQHSPMAGCYLVVSSAPFCLQQKLTIDREIRRLNNRQEITLEVSGPEAPKKFTDSTQPEIIFLVARNILDTIARTIYEIDR